MITRIKETCLYIEDIERTHQFYHHVLELPVISRVPQRHIFFRAGDSVLLCFLRENSRNQTNLPPHWAEGPQHIAFEVPKEEYAQWKDKLAKANVAITFIQQWPEGRESFYFKDPDDHVLEIIPPGLWG